MTTLNNFIQEIKSTGLAKNSKYMVTFVKPIVMSSGPSTDIRRIALFCDQTQLPGINISTSPNRTFGEVREAPYEKLYDPVNFSFYVDANLEVKYFFDQWMNGIQSTSTRAWSYYSEYTTTISILVYDEEEKEVYEVRLYEAFPKTLSSIQMDYAGKEIIKAQVTMAYRYWTSSIRGSLAQNKTQDANDGGFDINAMIGNQGRSNLEDFGFSIPSSYFSDFTSFQGEFASFQDQFTDAYGQVKEEVASVASFFGL